MSRAAVDFWFYLALFGGLPLGVLLAILWAKRILPGLLKGLQGQSHVSISGISARVFVYMIPGLALLIACSVPALYFGNLRKQREYCLRVISVNKGVTKDHPVLQERCGCFDLDELFAEHAKASGQGDGD